MLDIDSASVQLKTVSPEGQLLATAACFQVMALALDAPHLFQGLALVLDPPHFDSLH